MILEYCDKYKYLGMLQSNKNSMKDHIQALKGKAEAAYQTILAITGNRTFMEIEMESIWELVECTIISIITYGCEVWNANKSEMKNINSLMDNILRRILMAPQSTPREALYIETGLLDPETISLKQKVMMEHRMTNSENPRLQKLAKTEEEPSLWKKQVSQAKNTLDINPDDIIGKKPSVKHKIKTKTAAYFKIKIDKAGQDKSKVKYLTEGKQEWKPMERQRYLNELSRTKASIIFQARTRMLDIKNNFRNKYPSLKCRRCDAADETQEHVLETCKSLHPDPSHSVKKEEIFSNNPVELRETARKIAITMEKLANPEK